MFQIQPVVHMHHVPYIHYIVQVQLLIVFHDKNSDQLAVWGRYSFSNQGDNIHVHVAVTKNQFIPVS